MIQETKIFVVVPVFNRRAYLERFLDCFRKQTYQNFALIVVDDGSTDGTSELIQEHYPEVILLHGDGHLWWTGAINVGIRCALEQAADTDAVLIINDDLEVDPDYLEILHHLFQEMPRTLIGSVVVDIHHPDIIDEGGVNLNMLTAKYTVLNQNRKLSDFGKDYMIDVSLLTGRGVLVPVQVFSEVGLYDDKHFQQCGDIDLPIRAKYAGYRLIVSYRAIVRSHIEETYYMNHSTKYSLKDLKSYFFDVKSKYRLKYQFFFCRNIARNPFHFIVLFLCDMVRIIGHFFLNMRFDPIIKKSNPKYSS